MKENVKKWFVYGTIFSIVLGTLLHFVYEWTGKSPIIGIFGAINESTWEHLKLLFWPAFFFAIIEYIYIGHKFNNYIVGKTISFFVGIMLIITLFYTYTGIIGNNYFIIDISIFIISVLISQYVGYIITTAHKQTKPKHEIIAIIASILLITAFVIFTFTPPEIPLFVDPNTGNYGI